MKILLLIIVLTVIGVWLYLTYHRRGVNSKLFNQLAENNSDFIEIWYDGTNGKICLKRLTKDPITIEITNSQLKRMIILNFPPKQYITKIPVRGKLKSGKYYITTYCCRDTYQKEFVVKGCLVRIVNKNHE